jgi:UDP-N-acetylglucosamine acyltransferase
MPVNPVEGGGSSRDAQVHPTAVVDREVRLGEGVHIGPYAVISGDVRLGHGCEVSGHAVIQGPAELAGECRLYPYCIVGTDPQDQKYSGERTVVRIGAGTTLREFVTVNRGTGLGGGETVIGRGCYLMAHVHVAHDCRLGDHVVIANACSLAGHVTIGDGVVFGGMAACGQYVRVGSCAFVAAGAMLERDLPPYGIAAGDRARLRGLNLVGMKRLGTRDEVRRAITGAYTALLRRGRPFRETLDEIESEWGQVTEVADLLAFIRASEIGILPPA